jgi:hypothetical protein
MYAPFVNVGCYFAACGAVAGRIALASATIAEIASAEAMVDAGVGHA